MSQTEPSEHDPSPELAGIISKTLFPLIATSPHEVVCVSLLLATSLNELIAQHAGESARHDFPESTAGIEAAAELANKLAHIAHQAMPLLYRKAHGPIGVID